MSSNLECDFVQSIITPGERATADEIDAASTELLQVAGEGFCEGISEMAAQAQELQSNNQLPADAVGEIELFRAMDTFCKQPLQSTATDLATLSSDMEAETCDVWVNHFDLAFDWNANTARWENVSAPNGTCGVVTFSYLRKSGDFWIFDEQRVVTNPQSEDWILGDCGALEYPAETFDWRPRRALAQCTYMGL